MSVGVSRSRCWWLFCQLYNPENLCVGNGVADTLGEAMGLAWISAWWPDALIDQYVPAGMPWAVPEGWRFELTPPGERGPGRP